MIGFSALLAAPSEAEMAEVTGEALYFERIAAPPNAWLEVANLATTRMACPESMEQVSRFLQTLEEVSQYRIIGRHLEMLDHSGNLRRIALGVLLSSDARRPATATDGFRCGNAIRRRG